MIDTDKYEERIKSIPIRKLKVGCTLLEDSVFLRDTGLELLAEVKRLRERNEKLHSRCMHLENLLEEWQGAYE